MFRVIDFAFNVFLNNFSTNHYNLEMKMKISIYCIFI